MLPQLYRHRWMEEYVEAFRNMALRVYEGLRAAGIEIPFPQQDPHLRSISPEARGTDQRGTAPVR